MGCCGSKEQNRRSSSVNGAELTEFSLAELKLATNNFSSDSIVSESGEKSPNVVYEGHLESHRWIAVKKFTEMAWPDPKQFAEAAKEVGKLRHKRVANLIGYCCDGDERLLVADFMPNHTLAKHLFHWENQTLEWAMRLRVALYTAEALDYCSQEGHPLYHDLNAKRILLDENGDPRLSCFGLMENSWDGSVTLTQESVAFNFGTLLLELLSGKHIPPGHALDMIRGKNILLLMDSHLEGNFSTEEATVVFDLASKCLQYEPRERPKTNDLVSTLAPLQNKNDVIPNLLLHHPLSPMGDACSRVDLTAIHQFLVMQHYKDDEFSNEFDHDHTMRLGDGWAELSAEFQEVRRTGDLAFRDKNFKTAIECYSQFIDVSPCQRSLTVYARRSLCYFMCNQEKAALLDAMQAQCLCPDWSTSLYMQAVAFARVHMFKDAADLLNEAAILEEKKSHSGK